MKAFKKYIIDFTEVNYYLEMHAVIWHAFEFPDYYGCNWSAFWDCLKDMYGVRINIAKKRHAAWDNPSSVSNFYLPIFIYRSF